MKEDVLHFCRTSVTNKINIRKHYKKSISIRNKMYKLKPKSNIFKLDGKPTKNTMNLIKPTMIKLVILLCTALLTNVLIPTGWNVTDNFQKKHKKLQKK